MKRPTEGAVEPHARDYERYLQFLSNFDLSDEEKMQWLSVINLVVISFVDQAFRLDGD